MSVVEVSGNHRESFRISARQLHTEQYWKQHFSILTAFEMFGKGMSSQDLDFDVTDGWYRTT